MELMYDNTTDDYELLPVFIGNLTVDDFKTMQRDRLKPCLFAYTALFIFGAIGNLNAAKDLVRARQLSQYINRLMAHLTFADLCVIFISLPIEIVWRITISWDTGDATCRFLQAIRLFGMYLSSNLVVCISIDRLHAFVNSSKACYHKYSKKLLFSAYVVAFALSFPQAFIYRIENHPLIPGFTQCIQAAWFINTSWEKIYHGICLFGMYFGPLIAIVFCYGRIFCHLHFDGQSIQIKENPYAQQCTTLEPKESRDYRKVIARHQANRNSIIQRAKSRTLCMTSIIVFAYLVCWSPYTALIIYYSFDYESYQTIDPVVQEGILLFAVAHSCVNPFVYHINLVRRFPMGLQRN